ncbi:hypothetical protein SH661x_003842 [Planctomicrobium sp. SH661]|uniref:hypothetical protein n=1 Tax=Planctomicrobium sp. SH661 TaxID=3448124 RepID=UPI003F5C2E9B
MKTTHRLEEKSAEELAGLLCDLRTGADLSARELKMVQLVEALALRLRLIERELNGQAGKWTQ